MYHMKNFDETTDLVIVSAHYNEDLTWLTRSKFPVVISTNNGSYIHENSERVWLDEKLRSVLNNGREASCYIRFIVEYYDELPKHIAFIHGHETAWHQKYPAPLLTAIEEAKYNMFGYVNLNTCYQPAGVDHYQRIRTTWDMYFRPILGFQIPHTMDYCGVSAQFIVKKECIRKYPKDVWKFWLYLCEYPDSRYFFNIQQFWDMPWLFEYTWHILFGEPAIEPLTAEEYISQRFSHIPKKFA